MEMCCFCLIFADDIQLSMEKYYNKENKRLVYTGQDSSPEFWDDHWNTDDFKLSLKPGRYNYVTSVTKRFLPEGSVILEGGCGQATNVAALQNSGYNAYGVDYARETVKNVNKYAPELKVAIGDVRKLDYANDFFDGYWSLGVIEHFYEGFEEIASEMFRVVKPGGFVFVTCPVLSLVRKLKASLWQYPFCEDSKSLRSDFYQFALDPKYVVRVFSDFGFKKVKATGFDGVKGLKDEVALLRPLLQPIYKSRRFPIKVLKKILDFPLRCFANHAGLFIFTKGLKPKTSS